MNRVSTGGLFEATRQAKVNWWLGRGATRGNADALATDFMRRCPGCGGLVSTKTKVNVLVREDGGLRHDDCKYKAEKRTAKKFRGPYEAKERREHREAVRLAVARDGAIR